MRSFCTIFEISPRSKGSHIPCISPLRKEEVSSINEEIDWFCVLSILVFSKIYILTFDYYGFACKFFCCHAYWSGISILGIINTDNISIWISLRPLILPFSSTEIFSIFTNQIYYLRDCGIRSEKKRWLERVSFKEFFLFIINFIRKSNDSLNSEIKDRCFCTSWVYI